MNAGGAANSKSVSSAIVVGAGIAGMAAAVRLAEAGVRVTVLETRKKLGGRATSFADVRSGETLDNCQHVVLGCCTNYLDLLERLGTRGEIRWDRAQHWAEADGDGARISTVEPGALPAPLHFSGSMLKAKFLTFGEASAIGRCCLKMLGVDRRAEDGRTFGAWLRAHGQSDRVIARFWSPVVVSACNLDVDRVSAGSALHVFQEGFLAHERAADIGISKVPLVELYDGFEKLIGESGGAVRLGTSVARVSKESVELSSGEVLRADAVIAAVPFERAGRLVSEEDRARDPRFGPLEQMTHSPILGVHLRFDRPVMGELPHCVLVERSTQWLFRKDDAGLMLHAVISAADEWLELGEDEIARRVLADIHACLPASRGATLVWSRAVKEKLATFAPVPGVEGLRPGTTGPSGVFLAGDYVKTGWPATMEGAARSGYMAAGAALGMGEEALVVPGLKVARLSRMLGLAG